MKDLNKAQAQLDEKQAELEAVQAQYDQAMLEKQVSHSAIISDCRMTDTKESVLSKYYLVK